MKHTSVLRFFVSGAEVAFFGVAVGLLNRYYSHYSTVWVAAVIVLLILAARADKAVERCLKACWFSDAA